MGRVTHEGAWHRFTSPSGGEVGPFGPGEGAFILLSVKKGPLTPPSPHRERGRPPKYRGRSAACKHLAADAEAGHFFAEGAAGEAEGVGGVGDGIVVLAQFGFDDAAFVLG